MCWCFDLAFVLFVSVVYLFGLGFEVWLGCDGCWFECSFGVWFDAGRKFGECLVCGFSWLVLLWFCFGGFDYFLVTCVCNLFIWCFGFGIWVFCDICVVWVYVMVRGLLQTEFCGRFVLFLRFGVW